MEAVNDARAKVLDYAGNRAEVQPDVQLSPPRGSSPYFGWLDIHGDPITLRLDSVMGMMKDSRTNRYAVFIPHVNQLPSLNEADALRLMKRMGWGGIP